MVVLGVLVEGQVLATIRPTITMPRGREKNMLLEKVDVFNGRKKMEDFLNPPSLGIWPKWNWIISGKIWENCLGFEF